MEDEELLPQQEADDNQPEDRNQLLEQLKDLSSRPGPAALLLRAGHGWLQGTLSTPDLRARAAEFEANLQADLDDPLLISQLDRLEEGLDGELEDEVLYALLGLAYQASLS
ncbi:hypothetical protein JST97_36410 [bacterium]|nr:hypothetical protein [bacterium]